MDARITRREFLVASATVGAGLMLTGSAGCAGGGTKKPEVATPSINYGEDSMNAKRILVGYATKTGSTVGVAEKIGETLSARGFAVDVRPLKETPSVADYDAIVLGSAVNGGRWLPEAIEFVGSNQAELARVPVAMFCVHAMHCGASEKETAKRVAYLDCVRSLVPPSAEGFFAGKGPVPEDASWLAMWAFKAFGGQVVEGDGRDWPAIRRWANDLVV